MAATLKKRYAMVIDTKLCIGCGDCVVACKMENEVPEGYCRDWITEEVNGVFPDLSVEYRSERCNHCSNPPCVFACPTGASFVDIEVLPVKTLSQVVGFLTGFSKIVPEQTDLGDIFERDGRFAVAESL